MDEVTRCKSASRTMLLMGSERMNGWMDESVNGFLLRMYFAFNLLVFLEGKSTYSTLSFSFLDWTT